MLVYKCPSGEACMPRYEYICHACEKEFEKILTLHEYEKGEITCPYCGSDKVEQEAASFFAVTAKKS